MDVNEIEEVQEIEEVVEEEKVISDLSAEIRKYESPTEKSLSSHNSNVSQLNKKEQKISAVARTVRREELKKHKTLKEG